MNFTERLARACAAHPGRTFAAWGAALVGAVLCLVFLMTGLTTDATLANDPQSAKAEHLVEQSFRPRDPSEAVTDLAVVRSDELTVTDRRFRSFVEGLVSRARASRAVAGLRTYYATSDRSLVSDDRHATLIPLNIVSEDAAADVVAVVERADENPDFAVTVAGNQVLDHDFNLLSERDLREGELKFGIPAALIILLLVFGAVVAGLIPLLLALVSILAALGLVSILSQAFDLSIFIVNMLTGMGLALGIDYALFVISRYREERAGGREPYDAIGASGATASRAVTFSGSAFVVAMFGMLLVPSSIMRSLAAGAILVGITSVAAALTLLPALLGALKDGVDRLRIPFVGRRAAYGESPFWGGVVRRVLRRPVLSLALAVIPLLLLALPVLRLEIGTSGVSTLPDDLAAKKGFVAIQRDFSGQSVDPVQVVVDDQSPETSNRLQALQKQIASDPRFGRRALRQGNGASMLSTSPRGDELSDASIAAVRTLRDQVARAFEGSGQEAYVGGTTSENIDYFDAVTDPAPYVFAFVLGLTFILLTVAFRSVTVAGTAIVLNLISVGAAYGLLVLVFQEGVANELFGFQQVDAIEAWVPLFLFSVLFGLSMDYQVFLLSRIRERYDVSRDTRDAVTWGVGSTARIITGAALIIVAVFAGFARGDLVMFQQMGFGVAVSLLIDATVIRSVLLPSVMALLGERNWYLPSWLDWIPHLEVEGHAADSEHPQGEAASVH
ncbi:MAG TPA: MMPL family transporter [Gaiellaceae bacterium]|nr:MMPL family transporter [Gaiellaceae bacterium]